MQKQLHGLTRPVAHAITIGDTIVGIGLLAWSMRSLPLGTAYTVSMGIGAAGAMVVGVAVLGDAVTPARMLAGALSIT